MVGTHTAGARGSPIVLAGWAHVLRRFRDVAANHPEAELVLGYLYEIDDEAAGDLERLAEIRRTRSRGVSTRIFTYLVTLEVLQSTSGSVAAITSRAPELRRTADHAAVNPSRRVLASRYRHTILGEASSHLTTVGGTDVDT